MSHSLHS